MPLILALLVGCGADVGVASFEGEGDFDGGGVEVSCASPAQLAAVEAWTATLDGLDRTVAAPPDPAVFPAFFDLPGASLGPWFALDLSASCTGEDPAPLCADGVCFTPVCAADAVQLEGTLEASPGEVGGVQVGAAEQWVTVEDAGWLVRWDAEDVTMSEGPSLDVRGTAHLGGGLTVDVTLGDSLSLIVNDGDATLYRETYAIASGEPGSLTEESCYD